MKTSQKNIRVLPPHYSQDSTAQHLDEEYFLDSTADQSQHNVTADHRRGQFRVIPGQIKRAPIGYSVFVLSIPIIALLVVLVVNIVVSNRQYEMVELSGQLTAITQTNEALAQQVSTKSAPQAVAQQAADMGMVMPGTVASIDLATGTVLGTATQASEDNVPTSFVAKPTVRSSTGVPSTVDLPDGSHLEPVTVTHPEISGPKSNTVTIVGPQVNVPEQNVSNTAAENDSTNEVATSSVGSLQGPQVVVPESD